MAWLLTESILVELGEIIAGIKPGRTSDEEITIYDSTGIALQDVAVTAAIYEKAVKVGKGTEFTLAGQRR